MVLFRVEPVSSFLRVFKPQSFFWVCSGVASALLRVTQVVFRSSAFLHPAGLARHTKKTLLAVVWTPFHCAYVVSHGLQIVFVLLCVVLTCFSEWVWSVLCFKEIRKIDCLFTHFFAVDWCSVGANSGYTGGFQMVRYAACLVRRQNTLL